MEHLTEALDRLGVKTCPVCGKTGAKSLCLGCRSVSYCGKACQKVAWPSHKRECRRIVREKAEALARIRDPIEAAYAADEAMAADACRPNIPPGAECYICGNDKYWKGDLVRMCSCRGPHAGFVHVRCLVAICVELKGRFFFFHF